MKFKQLPCKSRSQAMQDIFAYNAVRDNPTYIEIGAYKPVHKNNTYVLDANLGYRGFSVELNQRWQQAWQECTERHNPIYWVDALTFDYAAQCQILGLPRHLGYLSCDIEPPNNTLAALKRVISQGLSFDCITFEHDKANPGFAQFLSQDIEQQATDFLAEHGYQLAVRDVWAGKNQEWLFENWYVRADRPWQAMTYTQWRDEYAQYCQTQKD